MSQAFDRRTLLAAGVAAAGSAWSAAADPAPVTLLNVSYDPTRELYKAYNDTSEKIVGRRLLSEAASNPAHNLPRVKELHDIFEGRNTWHEESWSYWLHSAAEDEDQLKALLDRVEARLDNLRAFLLPEGWAGRQIFLRFDGVNSAYYAYLNGQMAGFSKGTHLPAEFDVTSLVRPGENVLAVQVFRWCDNTYMEDQDYWRLSGIFRDVHLYSTPELHIRDARVRTTFDEAWRDATMEVRTDLVNYAALPSEAASVQLELLEQLRREVASRTDNHGTMLICEHPPSISIGSVKFFSRRIRSSLRAFSST